MITLHIGDTDYEIPEDHEVLTIGRNHGETKNNVDIQSMDASRKHCAIYQEDGKCLIDDLGSANGTFVNETRIFEKTELHDGDKINIGGENGTLITVKIGDGELKLKPEHPGDTLKVSRTEE